MSFSLSRQQTPASRLKARVQRDVQFFLLDVLRTGPIPQHVAFIMDGNRRYARSKNISTVEGYILGGVVFTQTVNTCFLYGIRAVTVYAFSIENFKRPKAEVDALMGLAVHNMNTIIEQISQQGHRTKVQILGRLDLFSENVQQCVRRLVERTSHHTETIVNFCVGYTAREEITTAMRRTVADCTLAGTDSSSGSSSSSSTASTSSDSINVDSLSENMYTAGCPPLDMIVRTSGERRLSDFLLWQSIHDNSEIVVVRCLWPEFGFLQLFWVMIGWQRRQRRIGKRDNSSSKEDPLCSDGETPQSLFPRRTGIWRNVLLLLIMCLILGLLMLNKSI
ncbi:putative undecaprenyl diphosphate synthase-domain-containing protein [Aspergillus germanicus]